MAKKTETTYVIRGKDETKKALKSVQSGFKKTQGVVGKLSGALGKLGPAGATLAGAATIGGIVKIGASAINSADHINKMAAALNISTDALSQYQYAAELSGIENTQLEAAFRTMNQRISESNMGIGEAKKFLDKLGVSVGDLNRLKADEKFEILADALAKVSNESDRAAIAGKIFGEEVGARMLPFIKDGSAGIKAMRQEFVDLGGSISQADADMASLAKDNMTKLSAQFDAIGRSLAIAFTPAITEAIAWVSEQLSTMVSDQAASRRIDEVGDALKRAAAEGDKFTKTVYESLGPFGKNVQSFTVIDEAAVKAEAKAVVDIMDSLAAEGFINLGLKLGDNFVQGLKMGLSTEQAIIFEQQQQDVEQQRKEIEAILAKPIQAAPVIPKDYSILPEDVIDPADLLMNIEMGG